VGCPVVPLEAWMRAILFSGYREHAERVVVTQVLFGGERQLRQLIEAGDVAGLQAGRVEDGPVVRAVVVGVADRMAQPDLLQGL
jgi:hypothetical protein